LPSQHNDLTAVMSLVRDEVGEHMGNIQGQVAPYIPFRRRHLPLRSKAQLEKRLDPIAAALQRGNELPSCDATMIHAKRSDNAVLPPERLHPHAPRVVKVGRDHAHRALWRSRNRGVPEY